MDPERTVNRPSLLVNSKKTSNHFPIQKNISNQHQPTLNQILNTNWTTPKPPSSFANHGPELVCGRSPAEAPSWGTSKRFRRPWVHVARGRGADGALVAGWFQGGLWCRDKSACWLGVQEPGVYPVPNGGMVPGATRSGGSSCGTVVKYYSWVWLVMVTGSWWWWLMMALECLV